MSSPRDSRIGYALILAGAASWGTWPFVLRWARSYGALPFAIEAAIALAVLGLVVAPVALRPAPVGALAATPAPRTLRTWLLIGWLGVGQALNNILFFKAYAVTSVAIAVLTHYMAPLLVAVLAPVFLPEKASARTYGALLVGLAGLFLVLEPWREEPGAAATARAGELVGAMLGAGSAVFYASNVITMKALSERLRPTEMLFYNTLFAVPLLALFVPRGAWAGVGLQSVLALAVGSLGPSVFGGLVFVAGVKRVPASHASMLTLVEPVVAMGLAAVILHEAVRAPGLVGALMVLAAAAYVVARPAGGKGP